MPIKIELLGQTAPEVLQELEVLTRAIRPVVENAPGLPDVTVTLAQAIDAASFQELHDAVVERFDREGYEVTILRREPKPAPQEIVAEEPPAEEVKTAAEAAAPTVKKGRGKIGRPPLIDIETARASLKGANGKDPEPESEEDPFGTGPTEKKDDKSFVLDKLKDLYDAGAHKDQVKAFMLSQAKKHGAGKLPDVDPARFGEIRLAMASEFA